LVRFCSSSLYKDDGSATTMLLEMLKTWFRLHDAL
jgi:hypothetical protein